MEENKELVIEDGKRGFLSPDETEIYYIIQPTTEDIRGADWAYSKMYTKCLLEGITTAAEMTEILQRRGIIGPEFEQRARELTLILNDKINEMEMAADNDSKTELAIRVSNAREDLFQWNQRLNGPMSNTCEQMADDARLEYLTSCMIMDSNNNRIWNSQEEFLKEKNQALALKAKFEIMLYLQGLSSDFLDKTPEAVAMREVRDDLTKQAEEALKVAEAFITEASSEIENEEHYEKSDEKIVEDINEFIPVSTDKIDKQKNSKKKSSKKQ